MPLGDIAGELLGGVFRFLGHVIGEAVLEILLRGPGYLICKRFNKAIEPDGAPVILVGVLFWVTAGFGGYLAYAAVTGG